jgi:hypothetical protein
VAAYIEELVAAASIFPGNSRGHSRDMPLNEMTDRLFSPTPLEAARLSAMYSQNNLESLNHKESKSRDYIDCPIIDFRSSNIISFMFRCYGSGAESGLGRFGNGTARHS